jgi:hypothetical protein
MSNMKESHRAWGSEWFKNRPAWLEVVYQQSEHLFLRAYPVLKRFGLFRRLMIPAEEIGKGWLFNCQMCGQCILHSTGMTCPMNCPKNLRNGPCGGVRANGHCEVIPEMPCVWVQAWERSRLMPRYGQEIKLIQPPVNRTLQNTSSWINMAEGVDQEAPPGWQLAQTS